MTGILRRSCCYIDLFTPTFDDRDRRYLSEVFYEALVSNEGMAPKALYASEKGVPRSRVDKALEVPRTFFSGL